MILNKLIWCGFVIIALMSLGCSGGKGKKGDTSNANDSSIKALQELETETMAIHDSIMPQMDSLMRLKNRLKDELKKEGASEAKKAIKHQIDRLKGVREQMMNWMSRYSKKYKRMADSVALEQKAAKLDTLHQDVKYLKKAWDKTLKTSAELLKEQDNNSSKN